MVERNPHEVRTVIISLLHLVRQLTAGLAHTVDSTFRFIFVLRIRFTCDVVLTAKEDIDLVPDSTEEEQDPLLRIFWVSALSKFAWSALQTGNIIVLVNFGLPPVLDSLLSTLLLLLLEISLPGLSLDFTVKAVQ